MTKFRYKIKLVAQDLLQIGKRYVTMRKHTNETQANFMIKNSRRYLSLSKENQINSFTGHEYLQAICRNLKMLLVCTMVTF